MSIRSLRSLFAPRQLLVLGRAESTVLQQVFRNIERSVPVERRWLFGDEAPGWQTVGEQAQLPPVELVVVMDPARATAQTMEALLAAGCRGLIWPRAEPVPAEVWALARPATLRILGPRAVGLYDSVSGFNLSALPLTPRRGNVALIAQSQSVAAAAVDWAVGRNLGLSWLAVTGAEGDIDIADLLDYAALDPQTRAIALQLSRVQGARKFMSAARAAARVKPVAVLQTQPLQQQAGNHQVRSAAFQRAGLVECNTLGGLFDAIAALERLPLPLGGRVAVVANGAGACALAVDALMRQGLNLASIEPGTQHALLALSSQLRLSPGTVDLGPATPALTAQALHLVLSSGTAEAVLFVHSPDAAASHLAVAEALVASGLRERLLTVWLGLETAIAARGVAALHGIATFPSADEAARALRYRRQHALTRELLMQTPPPEPADLHPRAEASGVLVRALSEGETVLDLPALRELLMAYQLAPLPEHRRGEVQVTVDTDRELGLFLCVSPVLEGMASPAAMALPPLDLLLARRLLQDAGFAADAPLVTDSLMAEALMRLGQLLIEQRSLRRLQLQLGRNEDGSVGWAPPVQGLLEIQPPPDRERLALAPYPATLAHEVSLRGGLHVWVRPVRASDEPAAIELLKRLDPEEIRLRFFHYIRSFTHDMAARMTQVDYDRELTLVALPAHEPQRMIAIATLIFDPDGTESEFALLVHREWSGQGLGRHLLSTLVSHARRRAAKRIHGDVLAENQPMLKLAQALGFKAARDPEDPSAVRVTLELN